MDATKPFEADLKHWRLCFDHADYVSPDGEVLGQLTYQNGAWWDGNHGFQKMQDAMERIEGLAFQHANMLGCKA